MLVQIARQSLELYVRQQTQYHPDLAALPARVGEPGASFVTLTNRGRLRGCIGSTEAHAALAEDVARNAVAAATRDPRFMPVRAAELPHIRLEVTILTPPCAFSYTDYPDLIARLRPNLDGVMLVWGRRRGLLLPQVWQRIPTPAEFLEAICYKAGIPEAELQRQPTTITVYTFQVQHFPESGYREPGD